MRSFLSLLDCSPDELNQLINRAIELKTILREGVVHQPLLGKTLAMIFELSSTRTRLAFETGMFQLGGHAVFLDANTSQIGRGEPIADSAEVLSRMVDIVSMRTTDQKRIEAFQKVASIPVINAMSDTFHPCQLLADMQTFVELRGSIEGKEVAFVGDGYNMCNSYINAANQFGFNLRIACPEGYRPDPALIDSSNNVHLVDNPEQAVEKCDLVVTDVWSSMGHEADQAHRVAAFEGYQINSKMLDLADQDVLFMHCLPAHRGEEISQDLLDDKRSVAWQEAGNRLHSQKALLEFLLGRGQPK